MKGVKFTKSKGEFKNNENSICLLYISVGRSVAAAFIAAMVFTGCATKGTHDEVAEKFREFQEAVAQRPALMQLPGKQISLPSVKYRSENPDALKRIMNKIEIFSKSA